MPSLSGFCSLLVIKSSKILTPPAINETIVPAPGINDAIPLTSPSIPCAILPFLK